MLDFGTGNTLDRIDFELADRLHEKARLALRMMDARTERKLAPTELDVSNQARNGRGSPVIFRSSRKNRAAA